MSKMPLHELTKNEKASGLRVWPNQKDKLWSYNARKMLGIKFGLIYLRLWLRIILISVEKNSNLF